MSRYTWVHIPADLVSPALAHLVRQEYLRRQPDWTHEWIPFPDRLWSVGIEADGTLFNPNNYPDDIVRAAVAAADARRHERRSGAAKKAAVTRAQRKQNKIRIAAQRIVATQGIGPRRDCYVCGRGLGDPQSIARGIGSECWQDVLTLVTVIRHREAALCQETLP